MKEQPGRKTELVSESNLDSLNFIQLKIVPPHSKYDLVVEMKVSF